MDRKLINPAIVQDIAAAIREKGGQTEPIVVNALGDAIRALPQGMGDNTTEVVEAISGEQPSGDIAIANAIAKGATDAAREHTWQGERATDNGREVKDGVAFVASVMGQSLKMAQYVDVLSRTNRGVTSTFANGHFFLNGLCTTYYSACLGVLQRVAGHRYLTLVNLLSNPNQMYLVIGGLNGTNSGRMPTTGVGGRVTIPSTDYNESIGVQTESSATNVDFSGIEFTIGIFDLTAMQMEDVVDADDFAHRLGYADAASLPYIPYGEQIINSKPTEVVSRGRNLWDEEWERGGLYSSGGLNNGVLATTIRSKNLTPVKPNTQYYLYRGDGLTQGDIHFYDKDGKHLSGIWNYGNSTFKSIEGCYFVRFSFPNHPSDYNHDICLFEGSLPLDYAPYMQPSVLPLPLSSIMHEGQPLFPTGELCELGDVKDEVDWAKGKAVKRIGARLIVFSRNSSTNAYTPELKDEIKTYGGWSDNVATAKAVSIASGGDKGYPTITARYNGEVYIYGDNSTIGLEHLVYFELKDPIEVTFDPAKAFYRVQNGGTEEAVMDGVSAPLVADIAYRDNMAYAEEAALLAFANERSGQNDADLGDAIRTLSE